MREIINFLDANPRGCLATVDEAGKPHARPWEFMFEQDLKLWFSTSNTEAVFAELQLNPAVEFCSTSSDLLAVRVSGDVIFGIDLSVKRKMLEQSDWAKSTYQTAENPEFEIFYLKHGRASLFNSNGQVSHSIVF